MADNKARRNAHEFERQLQDDLVEGRITLEQLEEQFKADAERPIDLEMFRVFSDTLRERLVHYTVMVRTVCLIVINLQRSSGSMRIGRWLRREREVDECVSQLETAMPLWVEQLRTVDDFLTEMRAEAGNGPLRCKGISAASAHSLAFMAMDNAAQVWRHCKAVVQQERLRHRHIITTCASEIFLERCCDTLPMAKDLEPELQLERAAALAELRKRQKRNDSAPASLGESADTINITGQHVNVITADPRSDGPSPPAKKRMKRAVAEPLIAEHLKRRPHDTAVEVAAAVECSIGVVAESRAWTLNQERLKGAKKAGVDPKAIRLDEKAVNAAGASPSRQLRDHKQQAEALDDEIDGRDRALNERIGKYLKDNPGATPNKVAREVGCTAQDVERRQAELERLVAEQSDDRKEDVEVEDPTTKSGRRQKWAEKRL